MPAPFANTACGFRAEFVCIAMRNPFSLIPAQAHPQPEFLPITRRETAALGWAELDVLLVSGDAYVDHPACGMALLGRLLIAHGFKVGLITQPAWADIEDICALGRPRLFAGVSAGSMDSMLAHYTAFRKKRRDDAFTPGGRAGARPNRAGIVYTNLLREAFPGLPVILGGIEASLRRISHYDFWSDALRRSMLLDAKADLLVYGMGEAPLLTLAEQAEAIKASGEEVSGASLSAISAKVPGLVRSVHAEEAEEHKSAAVLLPSHEEILADPALLLAAALALECQVHQGKKFALQAAGSRHILLHPPAPPLSCAEMDFLYGLPFTRQSHPAYAAPVPAAEMLRTSITTHRGCGGGCAFCSLALHQGRSISARSKESIVGEAGHMARRLSSRRGRAQGVAISDVGGPTGNMWASFCRAEVSRCKRASCLHPALCPHFYTGQAESIELLRTVAAQPGIAQVRMASGIRYDLGLREPEALRAYIREFTGGQLKVAPEHISETVLRLMRKPGPAALVAFLRFFKEACGGKEQYVVPYLMSAYPGCTDAHMRELADWLKARGWRPQQVQCFIPTPGTVATAMFYCGLDGAGRPIYVARTDAQRLRQHALLVGGDRS